VSSEFLSLVIASLPKAGVATEDVSECNERTAEDVSDRRERTISQVFSPPVIARSEATKQSHRMWGMIIKEVKK